MKKPTLKIRSMVRECVYCAFIILPDDFACRKCGQYQPNDLQAAEDVAKLNPGLEDDGTVLLSNVVEVDIPRIHTGPWDTCFGGGIALQSVTLIAGQPGAGKSTMSLQLVDAIAGNVNKEVLYVGTEEGGSSIKSRAMRLQCKHLEKIRLIPVGQEVDLIQVMQTRKPAAFVLDSLQGLTRDLQEQVMICHSLKPLAIELNCPIIVVSHVNKGEDIAGLMALQHEVDTTMRFLLCNDNIRELTVLKNRFGRDDASVFFDMTEHGLKVIDKPEDLEYEDEDEDEDE